MTLAPPPPCRRSRRECLFTFVGADYLARFVVVFVGVLGGAGGVFVPKVAYDLGGAGAVGIWAIALTILVVGLRASIVVTPTETIVTKLWFFVPYRRYRAPFIEDAWYGGDWGLEDGAVGVVVELGRHEVHLGSPTTMHALFQGLSSLKKRPAGTLK